MAGGPLPQAALAHSLQTPAESNPFMQWSFAPWVVGCLALSIVLYGVGMSRIWGRARLGHAALRRQSAAFVGGWLSLVVALVSPLDGLGAYLFSAHMLQHELMMIVAAPLLVVGRPFGVWMWALPETWRHGVSSSVRAAPVALMWSVLTTPLIAWLLHGIALWAWHAPRFFEAALESNAIHTFQHLSFLVSALFFWWAVIGEGLHRHGRGAAMLYLFTTMLHTGALGALLTFSTQTWYSHYLDTTQALGMQPVDDQQLGGLIMWVPGGLAYVIGGLALAVRSLVGDQRLASNA